MTFTRSGSPGGRPVGGIADAILRERRIQHSSATAPAPDPVVPCSSATDVVGKHYSIRMNQRWMRDSMVLPVLHLCHSDVPVFVGDTSWRSKPPAHSGHVRSQLRNVLYVTDFNIFLRERLCSFNADLEAVVSVTELSYDPPSCLSLVQVGVAKGTLQASHPRARLENPKRHP